MRHWIVILAALTCVGIGSVGCQQDRDRDNDMDHMHHMHDADTSMNDMHRTPTTMSTADDDVCPHCPGVQHATADGKCPVCGMPVAVNH